MHARFTRKLVPIAVALFVVLSAPPTAVAQAQSTPQTNPPSQPPSQPRPQPQPPPRTGPKPQPKSTASTQPRPRAPLGAEAFGGAGFTWTAAPDTFEATGLDKTSIEYGGGARVTGIWRDLFTQVNVTRWSDTGERVFIDSGGTRYPLGIPLDVKTTFVDVSVGWKPVVASRHRAGQFSPYFGGGAGVAVYSEKSPFAEAGDDLEKNSISYHVLGGVDVSLLRWLGVVVEGRYRYVPDILGEAGVSAELDEDVLGGVQLAVGFRFGYPRLRPSPRAVPPKPAPTGPREPAARHPVPPARQSGSGLILEAAPVFLYPDENRVPLRTLEPGTAVRVLEQTGDWIRIEFRDPQFGSRVGYVQRRFVQLQKSGMP